MWLLSCPADILRNEYQRRAEGEGLSQNATSCSEFHGTAPVPGEDSLHGPKRYKRKQDSPSVPAPSPWFGIGGVVMALGEFGVASLEEIFALSPLTFG
jgi:hypothetical protein